MPSPAAESPAMPLEATASIVAVGAAAATTASSSSSEVPAAAATPLVSRMDEVEPGLWIGDIRAATDGPLLASHSIRSVVSVVRGSVELPAAVESHVIPVDDDELADLLTHLPRAVEAIRVGRAKDGGGGVLVHCQAGMSRSATVVAAYLMASRKLTPDEAVSLIRTARPCTQPSTTFLAQLDVFAKAGHRVSADDAGTRAFYRERMMSDMMAGRSFGSSTSHLARIPTQASSTTSNPSGSTSTINRRRKLRCASCRRELALREHVLHLPPSILAPAAEDELSHNAGDATSGFGHQATITAGHTQTTIYTPPPILDPKSTCSGYFIEPMGWMDPLFDGSTVAGKLTCPNTRCKAKLGNFDWAGQKCGCKAWITPGFCLTRGKVDDIAY